MNIILLMKASINRYCSIFLFQYIFVYFQLYTLVFDEIVWNDTFKLNNIQANNNFYKILMYLFIIK